jgi:hypothetical protein
MKKQIQFEVCPKCHKDNFVSGRFESDGDYAWRTVKCACGFKWQEIFVFSCNEDLVGYELDENGNTAE